MWKEVVMAWFESLPLPFLESLTEFKKRPGHYRCCCSEFRTLDLRSTCDLLVRDFWFQRILEWFWMTNWKTCRMKGSWHISWYCRSTYLVRFKETTDWIFWNALLCSLMKIWIICLKCSSLYVGTTERNLVHKTRKYTQLKFHKTTGTAMPDAWRWNTHS
jgi:hypothetical protein